jgi:hypothetical protein
MYLKERSCRPCLDANNEHQRNPPEPAPTAHEIAAEIEHMIRLNQGHGTILRAVGYLGRETSLEKRLRTNGRPDLARKVIAWANAA